MLKDYYGHIHAYIYKIIKVQTKGKVQLNFKKNNKGFNSCKKLPVVGLDLMQKIVTGLLVQCLNN